MSATIRESAIRLVARLLEDDLKDEIVFGFSESKPIPTRVVVVMKDGSETKFDVDGAAFWPRITVGPDEWKYTLHDRLAYGLHFNDTFDEESRELAHNLALPQDLVLSDVAQMWVTAAKPDIADVVTITDYSEEEPEDE